MKADTETYIEWILRRSFKHMPKKIKAKWERSSLLCWKAPKFLLFAEWENNCALMSSFYHPSAAGVHSPLTMGRFLKRLFHRDCFFFKPLVLWLWDQSSPKLQYLQQSSCINWNGKEKGWIKMGQNAFEELSALQSLRQGSSQPHWSTSWKSCQTQPEYSMHKAAESIWCSFPFAGDHLPPQKHIPK